ncbi:hypothetical protein OVA24_17545 [Luteolibacter sp. SL250]|uniref:hypothetical protein n=1 Tax=Luteolibacter sp. SL250 TaxID=2995170 RepID=UPI00226F3FA9|nr:hypothetical protein [Luteolibacter sp. SL250]WAC19034.1 hypothetical protein OVA24_17545 [Luteolibacter sp. SL250]
MQIPNEIEVDRRKVAVKRDEQDKVTSVFIHDETYAVTCESAVEGLRDVVNLLRWKHYLISPVDSDDDGLIGIYWATNGSSRDLGFPTRKTADAFVQGRILSSDEKWEVSVNRSTQAQFNSWELSEILCRTYLCE